MAKSKVAKKEWFTILAPKIFHNIVLGETHVFDPEQMIGKGLTKNLMNLTNDVKRQNININFRVSSVQNKRAITDIVGYYMVQSSIKRLIRRNIEKITASFTCKTADNKKLVIKPLMITRSSTTGSVVTKIRNNSKNYLIRYISGISYDNLLNDLVSHKLQNFMRKELSKVYPLRICEIRTMEILDQNSTTKTDIVIDNIPESKTENKHEKPAKLEEKPAEQKPEEVKNIKPEVANEVKPEENKKEKDPVQAA